MPLSASGSLTGDAAHELKTSIAVLKSGLQLLAMNPRTTEQYQAGLDDLISDTERMEQLSLAHAGAGPVGGGASRSALGVRPCLRLARGRRTHARRGGTEADRAHRGRRNNGRRAPARR